MNGSAHYEVCCCTTDNCNQPSQLELEYKPTRVLPTHTVNATHTTHAHRKLPKRSIIVACTLGTLLLVTILAVFVYRRVCHTIRVVRVPTDESVVSYERMAEEIIST